MNWNLIFTSIFSAIFIKETIFYVLGAQGLNIHYGYTGLMNFGQAGFMAVGAYGLAVSVETFGWSLWVGILVGIGWAILLALLLGLPALRLRGDYLAIVTIAAAEIIRLVARSESTESVAGGNSGINNFAGAFYDLNPWVNTRRYDFGPLSYSGQDLWIQAVGWGVVLLMALLTFLLMRSPWGRVLRSIRENEDAVRSLGKNVYAYKMQSLVLGGVMGALGGIIRDRQPVGAARHVRHPHHLHLLRRTDPRRRGEGLGPGARRDHLLRGLPRTGCDHPSDGEGRHRAGFDHDQHPIGCGAVRVPGRRPDVVDGVPAAGHPRRPQGVGVRWLMQQEPNQGWSPRPTGAGCCRNRERPSPTRSSAPLESNGVSAVSWRSTWPTWSSSATRSPR
ncbi:MAG: branched-chain amino acid ABC transporter permease [Microthrixaceae bacterium]